MIRIGGHLGMIGLNLLYVLIALYQEIFRGVKRSDENSVFHDGPYVSI